jgi:hypothetical protein
MWILHQSFPVNKNNPAEMLKEAMRLHAPRAIAKRC